MASKLKMFIKSDTQQLLSTYLSRTLIFIPSFICTSFVRITNLPRVFVRSYRELEITKVTPTPKSRNVFRVELLTGNNTTSVLDTPQKTESKTKSGRRSSQFSDRHIWKTNTHTELRAVSRDLCLVTHFGTPTRATSSPGRFFLAPKPGKSALGTRLEKRDVCSNKDININAK